MRCRWRTPAAWAALRAAQAPTPTRTARSASSAPLVEQLTDAAPLHQLGDDEASVLVEVVDGGRVGVPDLGVPGQDGQARPERRVGGQVGVDDLDRHRLVQHAVVALPDLADRPGAELPKGW